MVCDLLVGASSAARCILSAAALLGVVVFLTVFEVSVPHPMSCAALESVDGVFITFQLKKRSLNKTLHFTSSQIPKMAHFWGQRNSSDIVPVEGTSWEVQNIDGPKFCC